MALSLQRLSGASATSSAAAPRPARAAAPVAATAFAARRVGPAAAPARASAAPRHASRLAAANGVAETVILPMPIVKIDNHTDPFATLVSVEFGDRLGELLDTITSLKNLGLNIRRAKLEKGANGGRAANVFFITDSATSEKVLKSARLEEIRQTILHNMVFYHPESASVLAGGAAAASPAREATSPLGTRGRRTGVPTTIEVKEEGNGSCSVLKLSTGDRPGLLVDVVSVLKDLNVNVVSAEIDTMGATAMDEFYITYHGEPLNGSMVQLVSNALQYYLSLGEVEREESY